MRGSVCVAGAVEWSGWGSFIACDPNHHVAAANACMHGGAHEEGSYVNGPSDCHVWINLWIHT